MTDKQLSNMEKLIRDLQQIAETRDRINSNQREAVDKAVDILHMIMQWANAYPTDIFKPMTKEDWHQHHVALTLACRDGKDVRSGSAAAADCMRFVVTRMKETMEDLAQ